MIDFKTTIIVDETNKGITGKVAVIHIVEKTENENTENENTKNKKTLLSAVVDYLDCKNGRITNPDTYTLPKHDKDHSYVSFIGFLIQGSLSFFDETKLPVGSPFFLVKKEACHKNWMIQRDGTVVSKFPLLDKPTMLADLHIADIPYFFADLFESVRQALKTKPANYVLLSDSTLDLSDSKDKDILATVENSLREKVNCCPGFCHLAPPAVVDREYGLRLFTDQAEDVSAMDNRAIVTSLDRNRDEFLYAPLLREGQTAPSAPVRFEEEVGVSSTQDVLTLYRAQGGKVQLCHVPLTGLSPAFSFPPTHRLNAGPMMIALSMAWEEKGPLLLLQAEDKQYTFAPADNDWADC